MASVNKSKKGNSIFPSEDKKTTVGSIPTGSTGKYRDTMEHADRQIKKNSNYKKNSDE